MSEYDVNGKFGINGEENPGNNDNVIGKDMENDTQSNTDASQVETKNENVPENEEKADTCQEESTEREEITADTEKESVDKEKKTDCVKSGATEGLASNDYISSTRGNANYTASYVPPIYIPPTSADSNVKKEKKHKNKAGLVALLVAVCMIFSAIAGGVGAFFIKDGVDNFLVDIGVKSATGTSSGGAVTIKKNDGTIEVNQVVGSTGKSNLSITEVVDFVASSVVEVTTQEVKTGSFYGQYITSGAGSGVIIGQNEVYGYIVTNHHVIDGADKITIRLTNGNEYEATLIDSDENMDIAVIRFVKKSEELNVATFGSSSSMKVGQDVIAIGNPLGQLGGTVTNGIVSALDREITVGDNVMTLMQTNAAINPGNSGGGLFNMAGELIGIVNAKESSTGIEGLGFAIPVDSVYNAIVDVIQNGYIKGRVTMDIEVVYLDQSNAYYNGLSSTGVYVKSVSNGSNFKVRDRINSINGTTISSLADYNRAIKSLNVGDSVTVNVMRSNKNIDVVITATEYKPSGIFG